MTGVPDKSAINRLYVEGADDFHVICALARRGGVSWTNDDPGIPFAPKTSGDKDAIKQARTAVKAGTHRRVGLVVDANGDPEARWATIRAAFAEFEAAPFGFTLPATYPTEGVVAEGHERSFVGVWMMPGDNRPGAVESFLDSLVPRTELWSHAVEATHAARAKGALFPDKDLLRAQLRAWLAWQKTPGAPYGRAIDSGYLASTSPQADALVAWFRRLFSV